MMPDESGVDVLVVAEPPPSSPLRHQQYHNNPVFFMLSPTSTRFGLSQLCL